MKVALLLVVQNSLEYIPAFFAHHERLFDSIFVVDHNSRIDIGAALDGRAQCIRADYFSYFQSEYANLAIDHFEIRRDFDWLFILDIDEFLPFESRSEFEEFLQGHKNSKCVSFNWSNGAPLKNPITHGYIPLDASIGFYRKSSRTKKEAINIAKFGGNFVVIAGAHEYYKRIWKKYFGLSLGKRVIRSKPSHKPLYHVISVTADGLEQKMTTMRQTIGAHGVKRFSQSKFISGDPFAIDERNWMLHVANYRVKGGRGRSDISDDDFEYIRPFERADEAVFRRLEKELNGAKAVPVVSGRTAEESAYKALRNRETVLYTYPRYFSVSDGRIRISGNGR